MANKLPIGINPSRHTLMIDNVAASLDALAFEGTKESAFLSLIPLHTGVKYTHG